MGTIRFQERRVEREAELCGLVENRKGVGNYGWDLLGRVILSRGLVGTGKEGSQEFLLAQLLTLGKCYRNQWILIKFRHSRER